MGTKFNRMEGAIIIVYLLGLILSIAMIVSILKIPAMLRQLQTTNKLLAKMATAQGVPETEIEKALQ